MKKIVKAISVLLIVLMVAVFFVACGEKEPTVYGTASYEGFAAIRMTEAGKNELSEEERERERFNEAFSQTFSSRPMTDVTIADGSRLKNVVFVGEKPEGGRAVVVSKWLYYYSLMERDGQSMFLNCPDAFSIDETFINEVEQDKLCMEKQVADIATYTLSGNAPEGYAGQNVYAFTKEFSTEKERVMRFWEIAIDDMKTNDPLLYSYAREGSLVMATLARYGVFKESEANKTVGALRIKIGDEIITLSVVGYYESEADKILSTGIDPNPQSEAYQKVYEQIQHPVFYSVSGDIFNQ